MSLHPCSSVSELLRSTLDPSIRVTAERSLKDLEATPGFATALLQLANDAQAEQLTRLAAVVHFKNFVKTHWKSSPFPEEAERTFVLSSLVDTLLSLSPKTHSYIADTIAFIVNETKSATRTEFIKTLSSHLTSCNEVQRNGLLYTIDLLFFEWRKQSRCDTLYLEILDNIAVFSGVLLSSLTVLETRFLQFIANFSNATTSDTAPEELSLILENIALLIKIFHSFNYHDIPEFFEENMNPFFEIYLRLLNFSHAFWPLNLSTWSEECDSQRLAPLLNVKVAIFEVAQLYSQKYAELWFDFIKEFVMASLNLLAVTPQDQAFDELVGASLSFLSVTLPRPGVRELFESPSFMNEVLQHVIIPNFLFRVSDEELMEDDPYAFVRNELENAYSCSRRRSASDLVKTILLFFNDSFVLMCTGAVELLLKSGIPMQQANASLVTTAEKNKYLAVLLVIAFATQQSLSLNGCYSPTVAITNLNVSNFFNENLLGDLESASNSVQTTISEPLAVVSALRYICVFRHHLITTPELLLSLLGHVGNLLKCQNTAVRVMATMTIDAILSQKSTNHVNNESLAAIASYMCSVLESSMTSPTLQQNDAVVRALLRCIRLGYNDVTKVFDLCIKILQTVFNNPTNPLFVHYVFECIVLAVRTRCEAETTGVSFTETLLKCEELVLPVSKSIIAANICDFVPYALQLITQLIRYRRLAAKKCEIVISDQTAPSYLGDVVEIALSPNMWEHKGYVPALAELLISVIRFAGSWIVSPENKTIVVPGGAAPASAFLGVGQMLMSHNNFEMFGFALLESIVVDLPAQAVSQFVLPIMRMMINHLAQISEFIDKHELANRHSIARVPLSLKRFMRLSAVFHALSGQLLSDMQHAASFSAAMSELVNSQSAIACSLLDKLTPAMGEIPQINRRLNAVAGYATFLASIGVTANSIAISLEKKKLALFLLSSAVPGVCSDRDNRDRTTNEEQFSSGVTEIVTMETFSRLVSIQAEQYESKSNQTELLAYLQGAILELRKSDPEMYKKLVASIPPQFEQSLNLN